MPYRLAHTISRLSYALVVLLTTIATGLSCAALLSQAVRTSKTRAWDGNINALIIGASYAIVLVASLLFCIKRRVAVTLRLHRISKLYSILGRGDLPEVGTFTTFPQFKSSSCLDLLTVSHTLLVRLHAPASWTIALHLNDPSHLYPLTHGNDLVTIS